MIIQDPYGECNVMQYNISFIARFERWWN